MTVGPPSDVELLTEQIRASDLHRVLDHSKDGVIVLQGRVLAYANPSWALSLGPDGPRTLLGTTITDHVHPDDADALLAYLDRREDQEGAVDGTRGTTSFRFRRRNGETMIVEVVQVEDLEIGGQPLKLVIGRDVTEMRRLHARMLLADRMMSVGTLAAGVAHEINNPLSYVMGNISYLAEEIPRLLGPSNPTTAELIEAIDEARIGSERVRQIVRDLQAFSRADHQTSRSIDVRRTIDLAINMAWIEIRHRARLIKDFAEVPLVAGSEAQLGQVFLSLLLTAAQALPEGNADKYQIRASTKTDGDHVVVEVADTGPGLSPELVQRVFDPFTSAGARGMNAGLGLSIAHSIVTELGGEITVESELGKGTLYRVRLAHASDAPAPVTFRAIRPGVLSMPGRVLIVDDEPLIANSLRRTLRDHEVTVVESGKQAIRTLTEDASFDVILCDLMMPELTGMDVYTWLRREQPGTEARMVFMTGGTFTPRASEFIAAVSNPRIQKPFELEKIREFVREFIVSRRALTSE